MIARIKTINEKTKQVLIMSEFSDEDWAVENGYSKELYEVEETYTGQYYLQGFAPIQSNKEKLQVIKTQKLHELTSFFNEQEKTAQLESSLGFPIDANEKANRNIDGLIEAVEGQKLEEPIGFCDKNNQIQQVTLDNLKTMKLEIILNGQFLYQKKWAVRNQINSIQNPDELEQFNIETSFAKALSE